MLSPLDGHIRVQKEFVQQCGNLECKATFKAQLALKEICIILSNKERLCMGSFRHRGN